MTRRRDLLLVLGGAMIVAPALRAQQKTMPVIGYLSTASLDQAGAFLAALRQGLSEPAMPRART